MIAKRSRTTSRGRPDAKWRELFKVHLPGYDPVATRGECWFDDAAADKAVGFFRDCIKHVKGNMSGHPFVLAPWQRAIVGAIFGWKRPDGTRRYREAFVFVPRKNGKTTLAAGLIHLVAFLDDEPGAEIYSAAADRDQARLVFSQAKGMVHLEPELSSRCQVYTNSIVYPNFVSYKALSAEAGTKHGLNTHFAVIDELHAQPNSDLVDVITTSTGSRRQPLILHITTSDYERDGSVCNEKHNYASKVRDGLIDDPSFLPVIYEATDTDDWQDPKVWARANPCLGESLQLEYIERECKRAVEVPSYENTFKRLHLNIRTQQAVRAIPMAMWDMCADPVDEQLLIGRACFAGLDLASRNDIAAWVLLFPPTDDDPKYRILPRFYCPKDNAVEREKRHGVPYLTWEREGAIVLTPGNVIQYDRIQADIMADGEKFDIRSIGADRWNLEFLRQRLEVEGVDIVGFGQGFVSMSEPTKELIEKLLPAGEIAHGGHPVLRWMANNLMVSEDPAGNKKPDKQKSGDKIDGITALVMALGRMMVTEADGSAYDEHGVYVL